MTLAHLLAATLLGVAGGYLTISDLFSVQVAWLVERQKSAGAAALNLPDGGRRVVAIVAAKALQGVTCPVCFGWWAAAVGIVVWRWLGVSIDGLEFGDLFALWLAGCGGHVLVTGAAARADIL